MNDLFHNDIGFVTEIERIVNAQYLRRKEDYRAISLFEKEDLEQEMWFHLFASDLKDKESMIDFVKKKTEYISKTGAKRKRIYREVDLQELAIEENETNEEIMDRLVYHGKAQYV